jgi:hypothetical protein
MIGLLQVAYPSFQRGIAPVYCNGDNGERILLATRRPRAENQALNEEEAAA